MNEIMYHLQLPQIHHSAFFNLCRLKGVSFDLEERVGTVFNLMDSFVGGVLGILTVGSSLLDSLRKFADCLDFIQKQVGPSTGVKPPGLSHEVSFKDVIKAIKALVDDQTGGAKSAATGRMAVTPALPDPAAWSSLPVPSVVRRTEDINPAQQGVDIKPSPKSTELQVRARRHQVTDIA